MTEKLIIDFNLSVAETEIKRLTYLIKRSVKRTLSEDNFSCFQKSANKTIHLQLELNLWTAYTSKQLKSNTILNTPIELDVENEVLSFIFLKSEEQF